MKIEGTDVFLLRTTDDELVIVDLDIREQWNDVNLYWPTSYGSAAGGMPKVWVGDDGGFEREVTEVYEYSGTGFSDVFDAFKPYNMETFVRRVIQKRDKYYPGYEDDTQAILMRMGGLDG